MDENQSQYGEVIGLDEIHIAVVTTDDATDYTTQTPEYLAPAAEAKFEAKSDSSIRYYDNKPMFMTITEGATEGEVTVSGVPSKLAAKYLGKDYDVATGRVFDDGVANPPWVALGFRSALGDGGHRHYWYLKGKCMAGAEEAKSQEDKVDAKTYSLKFTFIITVHEFDLGNDKIKALKRVYGDTTDSAFDATGWFTTVQVPVTT